MIHALGKAVKMINPNTNKIKMIFKCINDALRYLGKGMDQILQELVN